MGKLTWTRGIQFFDVSGRTPILCEIRHVAKGIVHYRSTDSDGPVAHNLTIVEFEQIAVRIASVQTDDESDVFSIQPDDMHRLILKALENGATFAEIGELIGLDAMLVSRIARRLGFKPKAVRVPNHYDVRREYSVEQEKAVLEALASGATYYEAGRRIERSTRDARYIADKYFVSEHSQYAPEIETAIVEAIKAGATIADIQLIAPEGFQYKTIKLIALRHGLNFNKRNVSFSQSLRITYARDGAVQARNDRENAIRELLQAGSTLAQVGVKFNITRERVRQIALQIGIDVVQLRAERFRQRQQAVIDALRSGMKPDEIVTSFHVRKNTVNATAKIFGFEIEKDTKKNAVLKLLQSRKFDGRRVGVIYAEIAKVVGATKGYVHRIALEAGMRRHAFVTGEQVRKAIAKAHEIKPRKK